MTGSVTEQAMILYDRDVNCEANGTESIFLPNDRMDRLYPGPALGIGKVGSCLGRRSLWGAPRHRRIFFLHYNSFKLKTFANGKNLK